MKKFLKWFGIAIIMLLIFFWFFGLISYNILLKPNLGKVGVDNRSMIVDNISVIKDHVYQVNLRCPIEIPLGKVTHLNVVDSSVVYNIITDVDQSCLSVYSKKYCRFVELGQYVISYGKSSLYDKYLDALLTNNYSVRFNFMTNKVDGFKTMNITAYDLLSTKKYVNRFPDEATYEYVTLFITLENENLPMDIGDGMTLLSITKDKSHFVYRLLLDKNYSINYIRSIENKLKKELLNNIVTLPEYGIMLQICDLTKLGIKQRLIIEHQNDSIDFQFNYNELQEAININNPNIIRQ